MLTFFINVDGTQYGTNDFGTGNGFWWSGGPIIEGQVVIDGTDDPNGGMGPNADGWHDIEFQEAGGWGSYYGPGYSGESGDDGWGQQGTPFGIGWTDDPAIVGSGDTSGYDFNPFGPTVTENNVTEGMLRVPAWFAGNGITMNGTSSLTLGGDNSSFTGPIQVNSGTLIAASATALGSTTAPTNVASGAVLDFATAYSGAENINLAGGTVENTGGSITLAGTVTLSGGAASTIASATSGGTFTIAGPLSLNDTALSLTNSGSGGDIVIAGQISGNTDSSITDDGTANLTLTADNSGTYQGVTTMNGGTLTATADGALGATDSTTNVGSGATLVFQGLSTYSTASNVNLAGGATMAGTGQISAAVNVTLTGCHHQHAERGRYVHVGRLVEPERQQLGRYRGRQYDDRLPAEHPAAVISTTSGMLEGVVPGFQSMATPTILTQVWGPIAGYIPEGHTGSPWNDLTGPTTIDYFGEMYFHQPTIGFGGAINSGIPDHCGRAGLGWSSMRTGTARSVIPVTPPLAGTTSRSSLPGTTTPRRQARTPRTAPRLGTIPTTR